MQAVAEAGIWENGECKRESVCALDRACLVEVVFKLSRADWLAYVSNHGIAGIGIGRSDITVIEVVTEVTFAVKQEAATLKEKNNLIK